VLPPLPGCCAAGAKPMPDCDRVATVHSSDLVLVAAVFLACAVEMVEALTIVVAVGFTAGWKSALQGTGVALLVLAALVAALGPALVHIPSTSCGSLSGACSSCSDCSGCARRCCERRG